MAGIKALVGLAFAGCIGLTFLVLGCTIPSDQVWWPLFVITFYILAPIPLLISKRFQDDMASSSAGTEFALFATTGIVVSAFALPVVLFHAEIILIGACLLCFLANIVNFGTILAYFRIFTDEGGIDYSLW